MHYILLRTVPIRHFWHNLRRPQLPSPVPIPSAVGTRLPPHCPFPLSHSPLFPICTPLCLHLISLSSPPSLVPSVDIVPNSDTLHYNDPHYVTVPCLALFTHSIYTLATCHVNSVRIPRILSLHLLCLKISDLTSLTSVTFDTFRPPSSTTTLSIDPFRLKSDTSTLRGRNASTLKPSPSSRNLQPPNRNFRHHFRLPTRLPSLPVTDP